jgi:tetratricopeptide (TPR) repeat protein
MVVSALTDTDSSPLVSILGDGGMGKTALALSVLHQEAIVRCCARRFFAQCEGFSSISQLITQIADFLEIPAGSRDHQLYSIVLQRLGQQPTLLCLDNFESLWDNPNRRDKADDFVTHLHAVPHLSLMVTMRGTERPASDLPWSLQPPPLAPLPLEAAVQMFEAIAGKIADGDAKELMDVVAHVPLAVKLVATLSQDQHAGKLLQRWQSRGTSVVKTSGKGRRLSLDSSISLSMECSRMQEVPTARDVLGVISMLPDGLAESMLSHLEHRLTDLDIYEALTTLQRVALIQADTDVRGEDRYQMLPPIRRWCQSNVEISESLRTAVLETYIEFFCKHRNYASSAHKHAVKPELLNGEAIIVYAYQSGFGIAELPSAAMAHSQWSLRLGDLSHQAISTAAEHEKGGYQAQCLLHLGMVLIRRNKLDGAEAALKSARDIDHDIQDIAGEASDLKVLGELLCRLNRLDEAEEAFLSARSLHQQKDNLVGEAYDLEALGRLYLRQDHRDKAEEVLNMACSLHRECHDTSGEVMDLRHLAEVHVRRSHLDKAQDALSTAQKLYVKIESHWGEADILTSLGALCLKQGKLNEARRNIQSALEGHRRVWDNIWEGIDLRLLSELYMTENNLADAEATALEAYEVHRKARDPYEEMLDRKQLETVRRLRELPGT